MLPLHDGARAVRGDGIGDGAEVGFLEVAVGGEGVGDARVRRLDQVVADGVVEALQSTS